MDALFAYYGLDWVGMGLSLLAVYQLGNKNRFGFINFVVANAIFVFLGFTWMDSLGLAIGNSVFLFLNGRGFIQWTKQQKNELPAIE